MALPGGLGSDARTPTTVVIAGSVLPVVRSWQIAAGWPRHAPRWQRTSHRSRAARRIVFAAVTRVAAQPARPRARRAGVARRTT
jgi:hypothetical protein